MRQLSDIVLDKDPLKMPATTTAAAACLQMRQAARAARQDRRRL